MKAHDILVWVAVLLLVDSAIGLLGANRWQKLAPRLPIQRIALVEAVLALVLAALWLVNR